MLSTKTSLDYFSINLDFFCRAKEKDPMQKVNSSDNTCLVNISSHQFQVSGKNHIRFSFSSSSWCFSYFFLIIFFLCFLINSFLYFSASSHFCFCCSLHSSSLVFILLLFWFSTFSLISSCFASSSTCTSFYTS